MLNKTFKPINFFLLFLLLVPSLIFAEEKPVGKILAIRGTVEFLSVGADQIAEGKSGIKKVSLPPWEKAVFQQPVYAKNQFRTRQGSRLKILFNDKSLIALGPNSTMKVQSYLYKPKDKLRQGVINVAHGLAMYIVNKSQKHKKSSFRIVTPTANIAARGTHGYISSSSKNTLVANQAGNVVTSNLAPESSSVAFNTDRDPGTSPGGSSPVMLANSSPSQNMLQELLQDAQLLAQGTGQPKVARVLLRAMMKNMIPANGPPTRPQPLTRSELKQIQNIVIGRVGTSHMQRRNQKPLIEQQEDEDKEDEEKDDSDNNDDNKTKTDKGGKKEKKQKDDEGEDKKTASDDTGKPGDTKTPDVANEAGDELVFAEAFGNPDVLLGDFDEGPRFNDPFNTELVGDCGG